MADRPDAGSPQWTSERFEAWLEQTAKNEDRSKQEILHRMMASFWVLTEFEDLVDGDATADLPNLEQGLDLSMLEDADLGTPADTHAQDEASTSTESPDAETVRGLVEGFTTYLDEHGPTTSDHTPDTGQTGAKEPTTPREPVVDELAERTDDLEDRQDTLEADHDDLEARHEDIAASHDELAGDHEDLAERVDADMAKVEQILKRLTEKYQESGATLDQVETTLASLLEDWRGDTREQDQLAGLLQAAHAHGIETGACQDCETAITLGLLTSPRCPHCSTPLVDVRPGGWFRSNTIVTADTRQHRTRGVRHQADRPQARHDAQHQQPSTGTDFDDADLTEALDMTDPNDPPSDNEDERESFEWTEW